MRDPQHEFLIDAAVMLHRQGTPSHRLERVMTKVSRSLGVEGIFLYTPTALVVSFQTSDGEQTFMRRVDAGPLDVDKLIRLDSLLGEVERKRISVAEAQVRMREIADARPPYSVAVTILACALSCGTVAVFFRGNAYELLAATAVGLIVSLLEFVHSRRKWERGFLEPIAGFLAAVSSLAIARWVHPIDDRVVTLASLIVLLPGLSLTMGLAELALGHLSAGVARLAGASATLLTLIVGVAIGWRLAGGWRDIPDQATALPEGSLLLATFIAPVLFAIVFRARWRQWPLIVGVSMAGFWANYFVGSEAGMDAGMEVGAFVGAFVIACCSNVYARLYDRPALIALTPSIIVLVPGSIGYRSLTAMIDHQTIQGVDFGFLMLMTAMCLVGGLLTANALVPPRRIL